MSDRFDAWTNLLAQRDAALASIAGLAALAVLNWHILRLLPDEWRVRFERAFIVGVIVVFYVSLAVVVLAAH